MRRIAKVVAAVACVICASCRHNTFTLTLEPSQEGVKRTLAWRREPVQQNQAPPPIPESELKRVADLYHAAVPASPTVSAEFSATFKSAMPADVGGSGWHTEYATSLGKLHVYVERFRGEPDLVGQWERRWKAADVAADVLLTWLDAILADQTGANRVHQFVDQQFRRDLKNADFLAWLALERARTAETSDQTRRSAQDAAWGEGLRLAHFLIERGYASPDEAPALGWAVQHADHGGDIALWDWVRRQILVRLGRNPSDAGALPEALSTASSLANSFSLHLQRSAAARARLETWARAAGVHEDDPESIFASLIVAALSPGLLRDIDEVSVRLVLPVSPFQTNGSWDPERGQVTWRSEIEYKAEDASGLPLLCYAVWSEPSADEQSARFGRVVLTGESLGTYCLWRAGLPTEQAERWDAVLAAFQSGKSPEEQLKAYKGESGPAALLRALEQP